MPKVICYTPKWLSRPSPGFELFNTEKHVHKAASQGARRDPIQRNGNSGASEYVGSNKTIALRGTEVFVVAGRYIRWSDLCMLKDEYEEREATPTKKPKHGTAEVGSPEEDDGPEDLSYRVLKVPVSEKIRQLSVSPNGDLLAIATSHTIHIALLPDSSFFGQIPNKAIKLKTYTVGPTTHVLSQSQVTNLLWHPFGLGKNCLVTVTVDAVIRLWEFDRDNRWSSDSPSLAIDLKKLVTGSSEEEDYGPDRFGTNRSYSSDSLGLEVASACFGGTGLSDESAWSAMTLWLAMRGGDVYALCPILPFKWEPSSTLIPSLSTSIVAKAAVHHNGDTEESRQYRDQYEWIQHLDGQEPILMRGERETSPDIEVYSRPSSRSAVPRLQGPFQLFSDDLYEDLELSDIHVIASKLDLGELLSDDESDPEDLADEAEISAAAVSLMTRSGRVYVCLDLEGVEGQWLPRRKPTYMSDPPKDPYLVILEGLDTLNPSDMLDLEWPTFSSDPYSRYSFFTTHSRAVYFFSLDPWVQSLRNELSSNEITGAPFRMGIIKDGPGSLRERLLFFEQQSDSESILPASVPACLPLWDSDLGYFVLTSANGYPHAATLDEPKSEDSPVFKSEYEDDDLPNMNLLDIGSTRESYHPSNAFWAASSLPNFLRDHVHPRHQRTAKEEIRLSTATLGLMTEAHRVTSEETHRLGLAAADLFRRCERLQDELRDQIRRANEVAQRTERVAGEDAASYLHEAKKRTRPSLNERYRIAHERHDALVARLDSLRKKASKYGGTDLSAQERQWFSEVQKIKDHVLDTDSEREDEDDNQGGKPALRQRCVEAHQLADDLIARAQKPADKGEQEKGNGTLSIPLDSRKAKETQIMKLLERQSALIDAERLRLERLDTNVA